MHNASSVASSTQRPPARAQSTKLALRLPSLAGFAAVPERLQVLMSLLVKAVTSHPQARRNFRAM